MLNILNDLAKTDYSFTDEENELLSNLKKIETLRKEIGKSNEKIEALREELKKIGE